MCNEQWRINFLHQNICHAGLEHAGESTPSVCTQHYEFVFLMSTEKFRHLLFRVTSNRNEGRLLEMPLDILPNKFAVGNVQ